MMSFVLSVNGPMASLLRRYQSVFVHFSCQFFLFSGSRLAEPFPVTQCRRSRYAVFHVLAWPRPEK